MCVGIGAQGGGGGPCMPLQDVGYHGSGMRGTRRALPAAGLKGTKAQNLEFKEELQHRQTCTHISSHRIHVARNTAKLHVQQCPAGESVGGKGKRDKLRQEWRRG